MISGDEARRREPNLAGTVIEALVAPSGGIVEPWNVAVAAAENAMDNGMDLMLDAEVTAIDPIDRDFVIQLLLTHHMPASLFLANN